MLFSGPDTATGSLLCARHLCLATDNALCAHFELTTVWSGQTAHSNNTTEPTEGITVPFGKNPGEEFDHCSLALASIWWTFQLGNINLEIANRLCRIDSRHVILLRAPQGDLLRNPFSKNRRHAEERFNFEKFSIEGLLPPGPFPWGPRCLTSLASRLSLTITTTHHVPTASGSPRQSYKREGFGHRSVRLKRWAPCFADWTRLKLESLL